MIYRIRMPRRQAGFTLIELLVVIAIIGTLVGLLLGGIIPWIDGQKRRNTKALLKKLDHEVSEIYNEAVKKFRAETPPGIIDTFFVCNGNTALQKAIWIKLRIKQNFPMSYAEALNPAGAYSLQLGGALPAQKHFTNALNGRVAANDQQTESAALLLIALKAGYGGRKFDADSILSASGMKDTDGDGLPEIVDGFGKAVAFFRWGTGKPELDALGGPLPPWNGLAPAPTAYVNRDTEDSDRALMSATWNQDVSPLPAGVVAFQNLCHPIRTSTTHRSYFTIPVIVSAGPDGSFGLDWYMTPLDGTEADNLYSFMQR
jgi:prepilin-type N-terminal cleavage/methylation domain-containing protein